ncbi:MAG TPA: lamin tail domain-containing protein, partial [Thermoplasmata archaeon]|nr:lamin tail domain-containing protein [Thermoplasmata archaeon]
MILTAFVTPAGSLPTPQANVGVSVGPSNARAPSLAVDATGLLHLVETDDGSGTSAIYYARSADGSSWSVPLRIDGLSSYAYAPRIAVEREPVAIQGRAYAVFESDPGTGAQTVVTHSDNGVSWTLPIRVDTAPAAASTASPAIAASEGRAYVAWSDGRDGTTYQLFLRVSSDGGGTWGGEIPLSSGGISNLQARVEAKGVSVVVVWREASPTATTILSARSADAGTTWAFSTISTGASTSENLQDADLFVDEFGVAHVAWVHQLATGETHVWYSRSSEVGAWSVPMRVDDMTGGALARSPSIRGLVGDLWIAWADQRTGDFDIYASWSTDGSTWGDGLLNANDLRVDDTRRNGFPMDDATNQLAPVLQTGGFGIFAAWEDYRSTTSWDVYYSGVAVSPLVITELQDEPAGATRVEIYNFARSPFSLAGVTLDTGASVIPLDALGAAPPRTHVVVGAPSSGADLEAPISLGSEGARVVIRRGGEVLAAAGSGPFGTVPDPLPGEASARYAGSLDYTSGWTRALASSFGVRNAVPSPSAVPPVVLNEVLFNPSSPGERFVELYARTSANLDLAGYRIVADSVYTFASVIVGPGSPHAALLEGRSPAWFAPLDASGDNVYLYDPSGRLLDMIGWTTPHAPGSTVARTTEGVGETRAYEETTAAAAGWAFDQSASLALVDLEANGQVQADIGTTVQFVLHA